MTVEVYFDSITVINVVIVSIRQRLAANIYCTHAARSIYTTKIETQAYIYISFFSK